MRRGCGQDGAGEFGKEALDEVGPGAVPEGELEAVRGLIREPVHRMIVEDDETLIFVLAREKSHARRARAASLGQSLQ
jgi:hypothetical protein